MTIMTTTNPSPPDTAPASTIHCRRCGAELCTLHNDSSIMNTVLLCGVCGTRRVWVSAAELMRRRARRQAADSNGRRVIRMNHADTGNETLPIDNVE